MLCSGDQSIVAIYPHSCGPEEPLRDIMPLLFVPPSEIALLRRWELTLLMRRKILPREERAVVCVGEGVSWWGVFFSERTLVDEENWNARRGAEGARVNVGKIRIYDSREPCSQQLF